MTALSGENKGKGWGAGRLFKDYTRQLAKAGRNPGKAKRKKNSKKG